MFTAHADLRLRERQIETWQVEAAVAEAELIRERPDDRPLPAVEMRLLLPDGTPCKAVWSWLPASRTAKLVTVHFFDR
ncbi:MAG: DUF4258 domain-containing protein [Planctomycetota bacterium]